MLIFMHVDFRWGVRFPAMADAYDRELTALCHETAKKLGLTDVIRSGIYAMLSGPTYETIAEAKLLSAFGVDTVGNLNFNCFYHTHTNRTWKNNKLAIARTIFWQNPI